MILYTDMVADLFHYGHVEYLKNIAAQKKEGDLLYVGIHDDETVASYKRIPVMTMDERIRVVEACKYVDKVISAAPLFITEEYLQLHKIDYVFIPDNRTPAEIQQMVAIPYKFGIVKTIPYTTTISTTDIIKRLIHNCQGSNTVAQC